MDERIGFGLYQSCQNRGSVGRVYVFGLRLCKWGVSRVLGSGMLLLFAFRDLWKEMG